MNKLYKTTLCFLVVVIAGEFLSTPCFAFDDEGFQYWSGASTSFDITKDWSGKFEEEFRFGNDGGNLYYNHSDLGFVFSGLTDWLDLGLNYRQVFEKDSKSEWRQENRPHFNITFKGKLFDFDLSTRSRFEFRDRENKDDVWRYRNKITVKFPFELTELKLKSYLADEVFVTLNDDNVDRNRLYSGFSLDLFENMKASFFYLWQSSRSSREWKDIHVLGTSFKILF